MILISQMKRAIANINSVMQFRRSDNGEAWPLRSNYIARDGYRQELLNLIDGKYPVISEQELSNHRLEGSSSNLSDETWGLLETLLYEHRNPQPPPHWNPSTECRKQFLDRKILIAGLRAKGEW